MLWATVIMALAAVAAAFIAGGTIRPFGAGSLAAPAPVATTASAAPSPSLVTKP